MLKGASGRACALALGLAFSARAAAPTAASAPGPAAASPASPGAGAASLSPAAGAASLSPSAKAAPLSPTAKAAPKASGKRKGWSAIDVFEKVLKAQDQQAAMECLVVREETRPDGTATRVTGTLKVRRGGYAHFEVRDPAPQKAVSDGTHLYVELTDVKQVMKYDAQKLKESGNFFLDLGSSVKYYAQQSVKRLIQAGEGFDENAVSALEMRPLRPREAGFDRMRVWVDHDGWVVRKVSLKAEGVETQVRFEEVRRVTRKDAAAGKAKLPPKSEFRYAPPQGFELFDMGAMQ